MLLALTAVGVAVAVLSLPVLMRMKTHKRPTRDGAAQYHRGGSPLVVDFTAGGKKSRQFLDPFPNTESQCAVRRTGSENETSSSEFHRLFPFRRAYNKNSLWPIISSRSRAHSMEYAIALGSRREVRRNSGQMV